MRGPIAVLHVDDDGDLSEEVATRLAEATDQFVHTRVQSDRAASEHLDSTSVDCVLVDADRLDRDRPDLPAELRSDDPDLPILALVPAGADEAAERAIAAGATDVVRTGSDPAWGRLLETRIGTAVSRYRAERAAEDARRWHRRLVEASTDVIVVMDPDGTIQYTSPPVERVLGYDPDSLVGEDAFDLIHPDDRGAVVAGHETVVEGDSTIPAVEFRCRHADGSWVTLQSRSRNMLDDQTISGIVVYVRDVTGRRTRERELARYESIVEASGDAVYAIDADGRFTFVNDAHETLTGYAEEEILGEHVSLTMTEEDIERGRSVIGDLLEEGRTCETFELDVQAKDGEWVPVENHVALLLDDDGELRGTTGILRDVSERRERERDLARNARLVEAMGDGLYAMDAEGRYTLVNDHLLELNGYDREEVLGADATLFHDEAEIERFQAAIRDLHAENSTDVRTVEASLRTATGEQVPIEVNLTLLAHGDGRFRGTVGVVRDITERKRRERELEQYETIVETVPDGVFVVDEEGRIVDGNVAAARMFGMDPEATETGSFARLIEEGVVDADIVDKYEAGVERLLSEETDDEEVRIEYGVTVEGERRILEGRIALRPVEGEFAGTIGVVRDVTDRVEREEALERYETVVETSGDGVYTLDAEGRYTFMNAANADILGCDPDELIGEHVSTVMDEEDISRCEGLIGDLLGSDRERDTIELDVIARDGERVTTETHIGLLPAPEGEFRGTVGFVRDITERKERERALERYRTIIEATGDQVYTLDEDGRFTYVNEALESFTGYDEEQLLGEHISIVMEPADVERGEALIRELLTDDARWRGTFEMDFPAEDGRWVPTENNVALLTDADGSFRGTVGIIRDISERKERERRLEQQNARLDQFASVVSHDLRNPLNVAQGNLSFVRETVEDDDHVEEVARAHDRMNAIIDDVLALAREGEEATDVGPVGLATVAEACWGNVDTKSGTLVVDTDRTVLADASRLQQLLENLIRNAVEHGSTSPRSHAREDAVEHGSTSPRSHAREDAVEHGSTSPASHAQEDAVEPGSTSPGSHAREDAVEHGSTNAADGGESVNAVECAPVEIRIGDIEGGFYVEDDGPGIPESDREQVFDVGFSTNREGTGFGLNIVETIAEAHGWDVSATEGSDGGARFEFTGIEMATE